MTIAQIIESGLSVVGAAKGEYIEGTPFQFTKDGKITEDTAKQLKEIGFSSHGVRMIDGKSGRMLEGNVYVGLVYYLRLAHLSMNKRHARAKGPVTTLTRQPAEGRSKDGGLRFGEMEVICLVSYAASYFMVERMIDQSDAYPVPICTKCHLICVPKRSKSKNGSDLPFLSAGKAFCIVCSSCKYIGTATLPYAFKLLVQELLGMGIVARLETDGISRRLSLLGVHDDEANVHPSEVDEIEEKLTTWARERPEFKDMFEYCDGIYEPMVM